MRAKSGKWSDVVAAVLVILVLGTMSVAQINRARETANRVKCASNLRQIGQAILLYSNDNRGAYPRTIADMQNLTPTWGTPYEGNDKLKALPAKEADPFDAKNSKALPKPNDVTAAFFLLVRTQDITTDVFTCPTTGLRKFDYGGGKNSAMNWTNFPGNRAIADHLSYSMQNPYVGRDAIAKGFKWNNTLGAEFAVAADMNSGVDALTTLNAISPPDQLRKGNSLNHNADGQNTLYGDGHVEWNATPFIGVNRDNIYTFGPSGGANKDKGGDGIVGSSVGPNDSVLLPTAKDVGVIDAQGNLTESAKSARAAAEEEARPVTPQEQDAVRGKIAGTFKRDDGKATMTISADKIEVTGDKAASFGFKYAGIGKKGAEMYVTSPADPVDLKGKLNIELTGNGIKAEGVPELNGNWVRQ